MLSYRPTVIFILRRWLTVALLSLAIIGFGANASDSDGDGIPDNWERFGADFNGDGVVDLDLPAMGADYRHKDVFIECDFMDLDLNGDGDSTDPGEHTHEPLPAAVADVVAAFSNASVNNVDGTNGINIHIDTGNLGGGNRIPHYYELDFSGTTHGHRVNPTLAVSANGNNAVLVWQDDRDRNGYWEIYAQRVNGAGILQGNEITVNSNSSGHQRRPDVAIDALGRFVVVWEDDQDENGRYQILARGFRANGSNRFAQMTVNSVAAGQQRRPTVGMDATGRFVVAWEDDQDGNELYQILARGFNADGSQRMADFTVNTVAAGQQLKPDLAMDATGRFVVAWQDDQDQNGRYQVLARAFDAAGTESVSQMTVNTVAAGQQLQPAIGIDANGRFVVAWEDDQDENGKYQILARGFNADGSQRFEQMTVNTVAAGQQLRPAIAVDATGQFSVAWQDDQDGNGLYQIYARGFRQDGTERFADRTVNTVATGNQLDAAAAADAAGNVLIAWEDDRNRDNHYEIYVNGYDTVGGTVTGEFLGHGKGTNNTFYTIKANNFSPNRAGVFHYCLFVHNRIFTTSSGVAEVHGDDLIVSLGSFNNQIGSAAQQANTLMHELGHNLDLLHGGNEGKNNKPNYNSVMNYSYQFPGVDTDCDARGNGLLDYSYGTLPRLNEDSLNEVAGMCSGFIGVNTVAPGQQNKPALAVDASGGFVVAWEDDQDENGVYQILARGFNADGSQRFAQMTVNTVAAGQQYRPEVATDNSGGFVVVWQDDQDGNGKYQILARGFNADGSQRFAQMTVNTEPAGQQLRPDISMDPNGRFVVVWEDDQDGNGKYQIHARGFNANGSQRFTQRTINSVADGQQFKPRIAMDGTGRFAVVWEDDQDENGKYQILARGFNANGSQRFAQMTVNTVASGQQLRADIGMHADGRFVVAWEDDQDENGLYQILARGFNANGSQRFAQMTVNTVASGQQHDPRLGVDSASDSFIVAWEDDQDENGKYEIIGRPFNGGTAMAGQYTINLDSGGQQRLPVAGVAPGGNAVVAWEDDRDGNGYYQIYGRVISLLGISPGGTSIDWDGDGAFETDVAVDVNSDGDRNTLKDHNDWRNIELDF